MWCRVVEIFLAFWLALSPWIFGHFGEDPALVANDLVCASLVVLFSSLSFVEKGRARALRFAHLANVVVALWLVGFAYVVGGYPNAPGHQSEILVGLTLGLFAIAPNRASEPPESWRRFYAARARASSG